MTAGALLAPPVHRSDHAEAVRLSEVVSALSYALDITEGQPQGHAVRTCLIGMRMADVIHLCPEERSALFYALILKDLGCSSNSARLSRLFGADDLALKWAHKFTDWTRTTASAAYAFRQALPGRGPLARAWHAVVLGTRELGTGREMIRTRCERGAEIARRLGLPAETAETIRALDEHWDGQGMPYGRSGANIPLLGRIAGLAQTVEVFAGALGVDAALEMAERRRGRWFDPGLVDVLESLADDAAFWGSLGGADRLDHVASLEPADRVILADEDRLDTVAKAFAQVIDAKSPYTARHSLGVANIAVGIADAMGLRAEDRRTLYRAGLLHDIGKLGVSNQILDKPASLTAEEMEAMRRHTRHTAEILVRVRRFRGFAGIAAAHHERLDGSGYHLGLDANQLGTLARILAVADVCEALSARRPYRPALPPDEVLLVMQRQVGTGLCAEAFEALRGSGWGADGRSGGQAVGGVDGQGDGAVVGAGMAG